MRERQAAAPAQQRRRAGRHPYQAPAASMSQTSRHRPSESVAEPSQTEASQETSKPATPETLEASWTDTVKLTECEHSSSCSPRSRPPPPSCWWWSKHPTSRRNGTKPTGPLTPSDRSSKQSGLPAERKTRRAAPGGSFGSGGQRTCALLPRGQPLAPAGFVVGVKPSSLFAASAYLLVKVLA